MTQKAPLYRQLADTLRRSIVGGDYPEGSAFPTEMEICETHNVSRHTAREALRILSEDGLIARRRGSGTVVMARDRTSFAQSIGNFDKLLQYAEDAHFEVARRAAAKPQVLDRLGLTGSYETLEGIRRVPGQAPIAAITVLVRSDLVVEAEAGTTITGSITGQLERDGLVLIDRVTQRMEAVAMPPGAAEALGMDAGSPALRTVRRFRDADEDVAVLSESFHPAGRFAYEMQLARR